MARGGPRLGGLLLAVLAGGCGDLPSADPAFDRARNADSASVMLGIDEPAPGRFTVVVLTNVQVTTVDAAAEQALREAAAIASHRNVARFHAAFEQHFWSVSVLQFGRVLSSEPLPYVTARAAIGVPASAHMSAFVTADVLAAPAGSLVGLVARRP
jgi:hypothetical protein